MTRYIVVTVAGPFNPTGNTTLYALVALDNEGTSSEAANTVALYATATSAKFSADARNNL